VKVSGFLGSELAFCLPIGRQNCVNKLIKDLLYMVNCKALLSFGLVIGSKRKIAMNENQG